MRKMYVRILDESCHPSVKAARVGKSKELPGILRLKSTDYSEHGLTVQSGRQRKVVREKKKIS